MINLEFFLNNSCIVQDTLVILSFILVIWDTAISKHEVSIDVRNCPLLVIWEPLCLAHYVE